MAFGSNTSQTVASAQVMAQFPPDVGTLWTSVKDTCFQMEVASVTLGAVLADPAISDAQGDVFIEFTSDANTQGNPSYAASSVTGAILGLGTYATASDAPSC